MCRKSNPRWRFIKYRPRHNNIVKVELGEGTYSTTLSVSIFPILFILPPSYILYYYYYTSLSFSTILYKYVVSIIMLLIVLR